MADPSPASRLTNAAVAGVCAAEVLGMAGYSMVAALLPQMVATWSLSGTQTGCLVGMVPAGYMVGVLPLVMLTDRLSPRRIYLACSAANALSCYAFACSDRLLSALIWRAIAGAALAGMHMPGLRALTDSTGGTRRARITAAYSSSFTVGASVSFLYGKVGAIWGWRSAFLAAGVLATLAILLAWLTLPEAVPEPNGPPSAAPLRVGHRHDVLALMVGYAAAIWGSIGLRHWIVLFLCFGSAAPAAAEGLLSNSLTVGALINFLGIPAGILGNELALRFGLRKTALAIFLLDALVVGVFGTAVMLPADATIFLSLVVGFIAQCNFANLTAGLLAVADPRRLGKTTAIYSCFGFGSGFAGILLFGVTLDRFGGTAQLVAWVVSFATCGLAFLAGAAALACLSDATLRAPARSADRGRGRRSGRSL